MYKVFWLIISFILIFAASLALTNSSAKNLPELKDGDIIFQAIESSQTNAIMFASNSHYTHVGIIKIGNDGKPVVVEAVQPVKKTKLDEWIAQGIDNKITIKRFSNLEKHKAEKVLLAANKYLGRNYDIFFMFDNKEIYCSELVYYAYKDALQISLGKIEQIKTLNVNNTAVQSLIKERWKLHPQCQKKSTDFQKCYKMIMQQKLITPASIANDPRLKTVYTDFPE